MFPGLTPFLMQVMSSLPSYSTRDAYLREVVPSQRPEATLPQVAVSVDGFIRHCPLAEILQRHLAHMAAAVTALRLSKSSVSLCLTEEASFIRPPWSRDRQTSEAFALKDGMGVRIAPFFRLSRSRSDHKFAFPISIAGLNQGFCQHRLHYASARTRRPRHADGPTERCLPDGWLLRGRSLPARAVARRPDGQQSYRATARR